MPATLNPKGHSARSRVSGEKEEQVNKKGLLQVIALREGKHPRAFVKTLVDASASAAAPRNRSHEGKDNFK